MSRRRYPSDGDEPQACPHPIRLCQSEGWQWDECAAPTADGDDMCHWIAQPSGKSDRGNQTRAQIEAEHTGSELARITWLAQRKQEPVA